jgi:hypothetical protein
MRDRGHDFTSKRRPGIQPGRFQQFQLVKLKLRPDLQPGEDLQPIDITEQIEKSVA